jgi:uncharacterized membrane protein YidH (DUF202 family)
MHQLVGMLSRLLSLVLLYRLSAPQLTETSLSRVSGLTFQKCKNEVSCYEIMPLVSPVLKISNIEDQFYSFSTIQYSNTNICGADVPSLYNTTCSQFFCSTRETISTVFDRYDNNRTESTTDVIDLLHLMHSICFFCNNTNRLMFHQLLSNNSCPFFWKHDPSYCTDSPNEVGENFMSYGVYHIRAEYYLSHRKSIDPNLRLNLSRIDDLLNLTIIRNQNNDHIGEVQRGEYPYLCYCPSTQRFGPQCDVYTHILDPLFEEVLPFMDFVLKLFFTAGFLFIAVIPRNIIWIQRYHKAIGSIPIAILKTLFTKLDCIGANLAVGSAVLSAFQEFVQPFSNVTSFTLNTISYCLMGACTTFILVNWLHYYDSASEMQLHGSLSKKNRIVLALMLLLLVLVLVVAIIGISILFSVEDEQLYTNFNMYLNLALFLAASVIIGGYALGFLVYGLLMYRYLKKVNSKVSLLQLRVTRIMIVIDLSFLHFMIWLSILGFSFPFKAYFGPFMMKYVYVFTDCSMYMAFTAIGALLFTRKQFRQAYNCM